MNSSIPLPAGTTNHGNPNLLCLPAGWTDILTFLIGNYVAHAATVPQQAGSSALRTFISIFRALILPGSGVALSLRAIWRHAATERGNPLKRAARSRALCMVVRAPQVSQYASTLMLDPKGSADPMVQVFQSAPFDSDNLHKWWDSIVGREPVPRDSKVSGGFKLDEGYYLAYVPSYAELEFETPSAGTDSHDAHSLHQEMELPSTQNLSQFFIGLVQALWATITIYRAQGDQIELYGYAAFGLTVVPYAFMSVINGIANLLTPQYPTMFMIRTPTMDEAERRGKGSFTSALEVRLSETKPQPKQSILSRYLAPFITLFASLVPLIIVGSLSGFRSGSSTSLQRGFTMSWLVLGTVLGFILGQQDANLAMRSSRESITFVFFLPVTIGGLVIVGLMMKDFGNCSLIG